jgi:hypothetical protein
LTVARVQRAEGSDCVVDALAVHRRREKHRTPEGILEFLDVDAKAAGACLVGHVQRERVGRRVAPGGVAFGGPQRPRFGSGHAHAVTHTRRSCIVFVCRAHPSPGRRCG